VDSDEIAREIAILAVVEVFVGCSFFLEMNHSHSLLLLLHLLLLLLLLLCLCPLFLFFLYRNLLSEMKLFSY
jgi:hypothetical protein